VCTNKIAVSQTTTSAIFVESIYQAAKQITAIMSRTPLDLGEIGHGSRGRWEKQAGDERTELEEERYVTKFYSSILRNIQVQGLY
jgi:hypothetical protein